MSDTVFVRTKEELKDAVNKKVKRITMQGELAERVNKSLKLKTASKYVIVLLGGAIAATPFTGGLSFMAAASIAALTGVEIGLIIAVSFLGLALILQLGKDYTKVSYGIKVGGLELELVLERATAEVR